MSEELIIDIYNAFNPSEPLPAGSPYYVECGAVRGNEDIFRELGRKILRSRESTCQLYTGHRGVGKSTELQRLKHYLEEKGCLVVYFSADDEDIDPEDTQYTDILLASTRHLIEDLEDQANPHLLLKWLESRWKALKGLALSEVEFDKLDLQSQIAQFGKLTASLRAVPSTRETIRKQVNAHTPTLIEALNEFIEEGKKKLSQNQSQSKLVVIVDGLDRIAPVKREDGKTNHEEIFIDRCEQLKALQCHVIYTVPISLVYYDRATDMLENYGNPPILPMIQIRDRAGNINPQGLEKIKELIVKRVTPFSGKLSIEEEIFDSAQTIALMCKMSGGHPRELMRFMQIALDWTDQLPIREQAVQRAIAESRKIYRNAVDKEEWHKLAQVHHLKRIKHDNEHRSLLFRRCVLEYCDLTQKEETERWHDVHPLILNIPEFQQAFNNLPES